MTGKRDKVTDKKDGENFNELDNLTLFFDQRTEITKLENLISMFKNP